MKSKIYVNEIGYRPNDRKVAVYSGKDAVSFKVLRESGDCILEKTSGIGVYNTSTQDYELKYIEKNLWKNQLM